MTPFGPSSKRDWTETAKLELGGPIERLIQTVEGIEILPYYDREDRVEGLVQLTSSQNEFLEPRSWSNLPRIDADDATANEQALFELNRGADGILFQLAGDPDPAFLLKNIELGYCQIAFLADAGHEKFFQAFLGWIQEKKIPADALHGAIFWKSLPVYPKNLLASFHSFTKFHSLGLGSDEQASPTGQIAELLVKAVEQMDLITRKGDHHDAPLNSVAFTLRVGTDFFMEIAKFKALRLVWPLLAKAYQVLPGELFVHATTADWKNPLYEPHGNMLNATSGALSAILGGCNALTVDGGPDENGAGNSMVSRVALNVSSILREESHLGKVADATAGSYYIDALANQIAEGAWKKFQHLVAL